MLERLNRTVWFLKGVFQKIMATSPRIYCAVFRAESALLIDAKQMLTIGNIPVGSDVVTLNVKTFQKDFGEGQTAPHKMQLEVSGPANSLDEAKSLFQPVATTFGALLAFLGNGFVDTPAPFVIYEVTKGQDERDFLQMHIPDSSMQLEQARPIDISVISTALGQIGTSNEFKRLLRAIAQYHQVLINWMIGGEISSAEHLWIATETLTPILIKRLNQEYGFPDGTNDKLADKLGIEKRELDPHIRREFIFDGNKDAYNAIRKASEGFEHGFMEFGDIRSKAYKAADEAAKLIRKSIFGETVIDPKIIEALQGKLYSRPLMRGKLVSVHP